MAYQAAAAHSRSADAEISLVNPSDSSIEYASASVVSSRDSQSGQAVIEVRNLSDTLIQSIEFKYSDLSAFSVSIRSYEFVEIQTVMNITFESNTSYYVELITDSYKFGRNRDTFDLLNVSADRSACIRDAANWEIANLIVSDQSVRDSLLSEEGQLEVIAHWSVAKQVLQNREISSALPGFLRGSLLVSDEFAQDGLRNSGDCFMDEGMLAQIGCTGACVVAIACLVSGCGGVVACAGCAVAMASCLGCVDNAMNCDPGYQQQL